MKTHLSTNPTNESHPAQPLVCASCLDIGEAFLEKPAQAYLETRRAFLKTLLIGGTSATLLPLLVEEAEADVFTPSAADQKRLGEQAAQEVLQKYKVVKDSRGAEFRNIGEDLIDALSAKDRGEWDYNFRVLDSQEINAFAVPGGNMFLFTGLMEKMKTRDEIAAVTSHEIAHVRRQHWAKATSERAKRALALGLLLRATRAGKTWESLVGVGDSLLSLKFSRKDEDDADNMGLQNMVRARYRPEGMIDLFKTLQAASGGREPVEFLSDHPMTKDRIKKAEERIRKLSGSGR